MPGILVCSNFPISLCMFIVLKALLISSATVIVRTGGAIWLNSLATVLFNVCSSVTTVLSFVPMLNMCVWYVYCHVRKKALLQCLQLLRGKGDQEGLCGLGAWYLLCQDFVSCYVCFVYCLLDLSCGECNEGHTNVEKGYQKKIFSLSIYYYYWGIK